MAVDYNSDNHIAILQIDGQEYQVGITNSQIEQLKQVYANEGTAALSEDIQINNNGQASLKDGKTGSGRLLNEQLRQKQEEWRQSKESSRQSAESTRVTQENSRKSAEAARVSAETVRVNAEAERNTVYDNKLKSLFDPSPSILSIDGLVNNNTNKMTLNLKAKGWNDSNKDYTGTNVNILSSADIQLPAPLLYSQSSTDQVIGQMIDTDNTKKDVYCHFITPNFSDATIPSNSGDKERYYPVLTETIQDDKTVVTSSPLMGARNRKVMFSFSPTLTGAKKILDYNLWIYFYSGNASNIDPTKKENYVKYNARNKIYEYIVGNSTNSSFTKVTVPNAIETYIKNKNNVDKLYVVAYLTPGNNICMFVGVEGYVFYTK